MADPEFDRTNYPELVSCMALPAVDEVVSVEIADWDKNRVLVNTPVEAVTRINMPRISSEVPAYVREPFEAGIGLGLLACRIINRNEGVVSIDVPTTDGSMTLVVPFTRLARRI